MTPRKSGTRQAASSKAANARVTRTAAEVKKAGATGKRPGSTKVALRNSMIVAMHARGDAWGDIAKEAGIKARACQLVVANARGSTSLLDKAATEIVEDQIREWVASIANYKALAHEYADTNQNATIGALRAADEARKSLLTLLENVGKLPTDYERFMSQMELTRAARRMGELLIEVLEGSTDIEQAIGWFMSFADGEVPALGAGDGGGD